MIENTQLFSNTGSEKQLSGLKAYHKLFKQYYEMHDKCLNVVKSNLTVDNKTHQHNLNLQFENCCQNIDFFLAKSAEKLNVFDWQVFFEAHLTKLESLIAELDHLKDQSSVKLKKVLLFFKNKLVLLLTNLLVEVNSLLSLNQESKKIWIKKIESEINQFKKNLKKANNFTNNVLNFFEQVLLTFKQNQVFNNFFVEYDKIDKILNKNLREKQSQAFKKLMPDLKSFMGQELNQETDFNNIVTNSFITLNLESFWQKHASAILNSVTESKCKLVALTDFCQSLKEQATLLNQDNLTELKTEIHNTVNSLKSITKAIQTDQFTQKFQDLIAFLSNELLSQLKNNWNVLSWDATEKNSAVNQPKKKIASNLNLAKISYVKKTPALPTHEPKTSQLVVVKNDEPTDSAVNDFETKDFLIQKESFNFKEFEQLEKSLLKKLPLEYQNDLNKIELLADNKDRFAWTGIRIFLEKKVKELFPNLKSPIIYDFIKTFKDHLGEKSLEFFKFLKSICNEASHHLDKNFFDDPQNLEYLSGKNLTRIALYAYYKLEYLQFTCIFRFEKTVDDFIAIYNKNKLNN